MTNMMINTMSMLNIFAHFALRHLLLRVIYAERLRSCGGAASRLADKISRLNDYMLSEDKASADAELADWWHICGTSYRMVLPDGESDGDDEAPFEIYTYPYNPHATETMLSILIVIISILPLLSFLIIPSSFSFSITFPFM